MKKIMLKIRIALTNISRIIMSFLFINLNFSYVNKVLGASSINNHIDITCYAAGPSEIGIESNTFTFKNVFIILVPLVLVIGIAIVIIKKKRSKDKKDKEDVKED